jgi:DNA polymerase V
VPAVAELYNRIKAPELPIRRINISFNNVVDAEYRQLSLFSDAEEDEKELRAQKAALSIKNRYGGNAVLKGMNLEAGGTTRERNNQIGGHKK